MTTAYPTGSPREPATRSDSVRSRLGRLRWRWRSPKISNPSSVTADEGGPVCYQQQVLATRAARGHRHRLLTECGYLVSGRAVPGTAMRKILPVLYRSVEHFALGEQDDERFEQRDAVVAMPGLLLPDVTFHLVCETSERRRRLWARGGDRHCWDSLAEAHEANILAAYRQFGMHTVDTTKIPLPAVVDAVLRHPLDGSCRCADVQPVGSYQNLLSVVPRRAG